MNKLAWTAAYLRHLSAAGAVVPSPEQFLAGPTTFDAADGTPLAALHFRAMGRGVWSHENQRAQWDSYIVQGIVVDRTLVMLVDTSVGEPLGQVRPPLRGIRDLAHGRAAGNNGQLGQNQLETISQLVRSYDGEADTIVVMGHVPLHKIHDVEAFTRLLVDLGVPSYVSAHTHAPLSHHRYCVGEPEVCITEVNIGSTTDWPMETVMLGRGERGLDWRSLRRNAFDSCPPLSYAVAHSDRSAVQACTHEGAARRLSEIAGGAAVPSEWSEPASIDCDQSEALQAAENIDRDMETVRSRSVEPEIERTLLCIAATASEAHGSMGVSPHSDLTD